jgi:hypothetical protein
VRQPKHPRAAWVKVDDCGKVIEASPSFQWALEKDIEQVERWCTTKGWTCKAMNRNIKHIEKYL